MERKQVQVDVGVELDFYDDETIEIQQVIDWCVNLQKMHNATEIKTVVYYFDDNPSVDLVGVKYVEESDQSYNQRLADLKKVELEERELLKKLKEKYEK